jgi:hypothetical protein
VRHPLPHFLMNTINIFTNQVWLIFPTYFSSIPTCQLYVSISYHILFKPMKIYILKVEFMQIWGKIEYLWPSLWKRIFQKFHISQVKELGSSVEFRELPSSIIYCVLHTVVFFSDDIIFIFSLLRCFWEVNIAEISENSKTSFLTMRKSLLFLL